jgi:NAD(P)-dependent dehydrogenase (short-subunit alcohol dehydrogenase family)
MRLGGQVIIVTGAARGIGAAIARRLLGDGARVIGADRDGEAMAATARTLGCRAVALDLLDADAAAALVAETAAREGRLDALVNNAGVSRYGTVADTAPEAFRAVVEANLLPAYHLGRPAALHMVARGGGRIVNMASAAAFDAMTRFAAYGVAKAALVMLTKQMASEFGAAGLRVNAVAPGPVENEALLRNQPHGSPVRAALTEAIPAGRYATPEEVAAAVAFLCSADAAYVNGQVLGVDGGMAAAGVPLHRTAM